MQFAKSAEIIAERTEPIKKYMRIFHCYSTYHVKEEWIQRRLM